MKRHEIEFHDVDVILYDDGGTTQIVLDGIKKMGDTSGPKIARTLNAYAPHLPKAFLDIGAHVGLYSIYMKKACPSARVIAVEPNPRSVELLRMNIAANNVDVEVIPKALWSRSGGALTLHVPGGNSGAASAMVSYSGAAQVNVETVSLRDLVKMVSIGASRHDNIITAKIDVEGAEFRALSAMPHKVLARILALAIEYHPLDIDTGAGFAAVRALDAYLREHIKDVYRPELYKHFDYFPEEDV